MVEIRNRLTNKAFFLGTGVANGL